MIWDIWLRLDKVPLFPFLKLEKLALYQSFSFVKCPFVKQ